MNPMNLSSGFYPESYYLQNEIDVVGDELQSIPKEISTLEGRVKSGRPNKEPLWVNPALAEVFVLESDKLLNSASELLRHSTLQKDDINTLKRKIATFSDNIP